MLGGAQMRLVRGGPQKRGADLYFSCIIRWNWTLRGLLCTSARGEQGRRTGRAEGTKSPRPSYYRER